MRRRGVLLLTSIVVMVVVGAGVALAANINCNGGGCLGTNQSDNITGSQQADTITAASGNDTVNARGGADQVYGDGANDTLNLGGGSDYGEGGRGSNTVNGQNGNGDVSNVVDGDANDFAAGGDGTNDSCIIDFESAAIFGQPGTNDDFSNTCEFLFFTVQP
jgi:Ca2+-binding RTX toxin-like protein